MRWTVVFTVVCGMLCSLGGDGRVPNYWCTWATQGSDRPVDGAPGKLRFAGDQGNTRSQRDNLNDHTLFENPGWAVKFYPKCRGDLYLLLDAGWDLPYGCEISDAGNRLRGASFPHPDRFAAPEGATPGQRMKTVNDRIKTLGWRGAAVWLPAQIPGEPREGAEKQIPLDEGRRIWGDRFRILKEGEVEYVKVDWGFFHSYDAAFRKMMCEARDEVYPSLTIEHCWPCGPLNGLKFEKDGSVIGPGSYFGDLAGFTRRDRMWWERDQLKEILACSDVFRTYDTIGPMNEVSTLDRCAFLSEIAESVKAKTLFNVEVDVSIALALGHVIGAMSAKDRHEADMRIALAWQKLAPPFGHDRGILTVRSAELLRDEWRYADDCSWFSEAKGRLVHQCAPAVVMRGLPLPEVKGAQADEVPYVCGARYPNGAMALAFLSRCIGGRKGVQFLADIVLDAKLEPDRPLALFRAFRSLTLRGGVPKGAKILAKTLPDGSARDVTDLCRRNGDGSVTIPGSVSSMNAGPGLQNVVLFTFLMDRSLEMKSL